MNLNELEIKEAIGSLEYWQSTKYMKRKDIKILITLAQQVLDVKGFPDLIPNEAIKIEPPLKDGRYWKLLIDNMVVALIPSEELAIDLVRKVFSRNEYLKDCNIYHTKVVMEKDREIERLNNKIKYLLGKIK
jgi:hypothetical protein